MLYNFLKFILSIITKPFNTSTFTICDIQHRLYVAEDPELIASELLKLEVMLKAFINREKIIKTNIPAKGSSLIDVLVDISPVSIPMNLEEIHQLFVNSNTETYSDAKRFEDLLSAIDLYLDTRFIDVMMGRFFRMLMNHYWEPGVGVPQVSAARIQATYQLYPWIWVLIPLQNIALMATSTTSFKMTPEQKMILIDKLKHGTFGKEPKEADAYLNDFLQF